MQSEPHEDLLKKLSDITKEVKNALETNDTQSFPSLTKEHKNVMNALKKAGLSRDPQLFELVKEIRDQVHEVVKKMESRRRETAEELNAIGNKKKLAAAYGKFG